MVDFSQQILRENHKVNKIKHYVKQKSGLAKDVIDELYESNKKIGKTDDEIMSYFKSLYDDADGMKISSLSSDFLKFANDNIGVDGGNKFNNEFVTLLDKHSSQPINVTNNDVKNLDNVNLIAVVQKLLSIKNPQLIEEINSKIGYSVISGKNDITEKAPQLAEKFQQLNESETINLYESLKVVLMKNNRRWGFSNQIVDTYTTMMEYLDREIQTIQTKASIYSLDENIGLRIITDLCSGKPSPEYFHSNYVKGMVADLQTFALDIVLVITKYMSTQNQVMAFLSKSKVAEWKSISEALFVKLFSSCNNSKLLDKDFLREIQQNGVDNRHQHNVIFFASKIDNDSAGIHLESISAYNLNLLVQLLHSMTTEFNLSFRATFNRYTTITKFFIDNLERKKAEYLRFYGSNSPIYI